MDNPAALQAINDALTANEEANQALADGDLGLYQEKQDEAAAATRRAQQALGGG